MQEASIKEQAFLLLLKLQIERKKGRLQICQEYQIYCLLIAGWSRPKSEAEYDMDAIMNHKLCIWNLSRSTYTPSGE